MLTSTTLAESHGAACVAAPPDGPWIDPDGHSVRALGAACAVCGYARTPSNAHLHVDCAPPDAAALCRALEDATELRPLRNGRVTMWFTAEDGRRTMIEDADTMTALREYARREARRAERAGRAAS